MLDARQQAEIGIIGSDETDDRIAIGRREAEGSAGDVGARVQARQAGKWCGWIGGVELCSNCRSLACLDVPVLAYMRWR